MSITQKLLKHSFVYGLGSVLPKIIGFFLIPVYTYYLTPSDFGIVDLAATLGAFLIILMRMGIPGAVTRFYYDHSEGKNLNDYITTIYWLIISISLIIGLLVLVLGKPIIENLIPGLPFIPFVVLVILASIFSSNSDLQRRLIQVREQSKLSAKLTTSKALITILLTITLVVGFKYGALGVVISTSAVALLYFMQAQVYLSENLRGKVNPKVLYPSLLYASGILPAHILSNFAPLATRSVLSSTDSLALVGIFGIAMRFTSPLLIIASAFQRAYLPVYYGIRKSNDAEQLKDLTSTIVRFWFISLAIFLAVVMIAPGIIDLVLPTAYTSVGTLVQILSVGFIFQILYQFFGLEVFYSKKTYWVIVMAAIAALVNIIFVIAFVDLLGVFSLAIGAVLAQLVTAVIGIIVSGKQVKIDFHYGVMIKMGVVAILILASFFIIAFFYDFQVMGRVLLGIAGLGFFYLLITNVLGVVSINDFRNP